MIYLPGFETLKLNKDFRRLYGRGRSFVHPALVTYISRNRLGICRIGVTTSKKIGIAVVRNRARRIIMASWRQCAPSINDGYDIVFVARASTPFLKSTDISRIMSKHLIGAGAIKQ